MSAFRRNFYRVVMDGGVVTTGIEPVDDGHVRGACDVDRSLGLARADRAGVASQPAGAPHAGRRRDRGSARVRGHGSPPLDPESGRAGALTPARLAAEIR